MRNDADVFFYKIRYECSADPNTGNILNFNVGTNVDFRVPRVCLPCIMPVVSAIHSSLHVYPYSCSPFGVSSRDGSETSFIGQIMEKM